MPDIKYFTFILPGKTIHADKRMCARSVAARIIISLSQHRLQYSTSQSDWSCCNN